MLLILTNEEEFSTDNTIEWLIHKGIPFYRINDHFTTFLSGTLLTNKSLICGISYGNTVLDLNQFSKVWFRRGSLHYFYPYATTRNEKNEYVENHLRAEMKTISHFFYDVLSKKKSLNHPLQYNMNKLIALQNAIEVGFEIPPTLITNSKQVLNEFETIENALISKPIQDCMSINENEVIDLVCEVIPENKQERFSHSLFQKKIPLKIELRLFFINDTIFTAAIHKKGSFSKNVDPAGTRIVPYSLPEEIEEKVIRFMKISNLNSGSLDMILTPDNRYVFLEVNPVGQFDYVSKLCNYYLKREIADFFKNETI